jgi:hypothetical protein
MMNEKLEMINVLTESINEMAAICEQAVQAHNLSGRDVMTVLSVIDPETIETLNTVMSFWGQHQPQSQPIHNDDVVVTSSTNTTEEMPASPNAPSCVDAFSVKTIEDITRIMIKHNFNVTETLKECEEKNIRCSKYACYMIKSKRRYAEVTDKLFTKNGNIITIVTDDTATETDTPAVETKNEDVVTTAADLSTVTLPPEMIKKLVQDKLSETRNSIKKTFTWCEEQSIDVNIFDVFNIAYENRRDQPIKNDDICVVVRHIAPDYDYNIGDISRVMRDKCDIILDATHFHVIRKMALKVGKNAGESDRIVSRKSDLSDDDDAISHVLCRLEMNILQTFLHFRATPYPITIFDAYKVKQKIGTITDTDVKTICINLQRSAGIIRPSDISEKLQDIIGVYLDPIEVKNILDYYDENRKRRLAMANA